MRNAIVVKGRAHWRESKISPKAVCYDDIQGILRALTHFSLAFRTLGVYLLVEQFPRKEFLFDLRPFRDEEEHRLYRMDEKKTFTMIVNPQLIDESVYRSGVSIIVQGIYSTLILCDSSNIETGCAEMFLQWIRTSSTKNWGKNRLLFLYSV